MHAGSEFEVTIDSSRSAPTAAAVAVEPQGPATEQRAAAAEVSDSHGPAPRMLTKGRVSVSIKLIEQIQLAF